MTDAPSLDIMKAFGNRCWPLSASDALTLIYHDRYDAVYAMLIIAEGSERAAQRLNDMAGPIGVHLGHYYAMRRHSWTFARPQASDLDFMRLPRDFETLKGAEFERAQADATMLAHAALLTE